MIIWELPQVILQLHRWPECEWFTHSDIMTTGSTDLHFWPTGLSTWRLFSSKPHPFLYPCLSWSFAVPTTPEPASTQLDTSAPICSCSPPLYSACTRYMLHSSKSYQDFGQFRSTFFSGTDSLGYCTTIGYPSKYECFLFRTARRVKCSILLCFSQISSGSSFIYNDP